MTTWEKTLAKILRGASDTNIGFDDLRQVLEHLSFVERVRGDHHIFWREGVVEILNLQPRNNQAKAYQVHTDEWALSSPKILWGAAYTCM